MTSYRIKINDRDQFQVEGNGETFSVNGQTLTPDIIRLSEDSFHVLFRDRSYNVEVVTSNASARTGQLKVNGKLFSFSARDRLDELLEKMGMAGEAARKVNDLKAPMPGLVLKILVNPGQQVHKGDNLLVLEAMKMENIIKSAGDGIVAAVAVGAGQSVEKNQVLIRFE